MTEMTEMTGMTMMTLMNRMISLTRMTEMTDLLLKSKLPIASHFLHDGKCYAALVAHHEDRVAPESLKGQFLA